MDRSPRTAAANSLGGRVPRKRVRVSLRAARAARGGARVSHASVCAASVLHSSQPSACRAAGGTGSQGSSACCDAPLQDSRQGLG